MREKGEILMIKPIWQFFAEGEPATNTEPPAGKTFSEEYVQALRGESANHRTRARAAETALRQVLGLGETDDLGDVNARISAFKASQESAQAKALEKANARLIAAEMKSLTDYDQKLLGKLIDLSKVTVDDSGAVKGLKEAAEAAAKEFPQLRISTRQSFAPANSGGGNDGGNKNALINDFIRGRRN